MTTMNNQYPPHVDSVLVSCRNPQRHRKRCDAVLVGSSDSGVVHIKLQRHMLHRGLSTSLGSAPPEASPGGDYDPGGIKIEATGFSV